MFKNNRINHLVVTFLVLIIFGLFSGCAASSFIGYKISPDYPKYERENLDLEGLQNPVAIYFDEAGVPHFDASSELDLLRAVGFIQSRDRFFAMDLMRRIARGRLSELVGEQDFLFSTTVKFDLSMRGWGFDKAVVEDVQGLQGEALTKMQAYVDGVNAALKIYTPLEYRLLRIDPEPWTLEDSFALGRLNAWSVTHNWHQENARFILALHMGLEKATELYGHDFWPGSSTLPDKDITRELPPAIAPELLDMFPERPYKEQDLSKHANTSYLAQSAAMIVSASNAWVIGGNKTESGQPMLANDPHMALMLPSIMYQMHLKAPGLDVIGATIPGLPYILSGHNRHAAWGLTSAVADVTDLYIERLNPKNDQEYETPTGFLPFVREEHIIKVRDGSKLIEKKYTIRRTRHGAVMNDMYPDEYPEWSPILTVKWNMSGISKAIEALAKSNRAKTVDDVRNAMSEVATPVSTFMAADSSGAIAFFATGSLPIRKNHLGTFPVPGWLDKYEWSGMLDPMDMPYAKASADGVFVHANNLLVNPKHNDIFFQVDSGPSYRRDRIMEMLNASEKHSFETIAKIQNDYKVLRGQMITPFMLEDLDACKSFSKIEQDALKLLQDWDFNSTVESKGALVFFVTYREVILAALKDKADDHGYHYIASQRYTSNAADLWFKDKTHLAWDNRATENQENRSDVVLAAFKRAVKFIVKEQGDDLSLWNWGSLHYIHAKHLFGGKKSLAKLLNLPIAKGAGGADSVAQMRFDIGHPKTPFRAMYGPVYRMIVDFADLDHGKWILDTGISAWPGSPHYGDQHKLWLKGEYMPMLFNWDEVKSLANESGSVLILEVAK